VVEARWTLLNREGTNVPVPKLHAVSELDFQSYVSRFWPIGSLSPRTEAEETSVVQQRLMPYFGSIRLDEVNGAVVREFQARMRKLGYSPVTVNITIRVLHKIVRDSVDRGVLESIHTWPRPLPEPEMHGELTTQERNRFLKALRGKHRAFFVVALESGLDRSDLLSLEKNAVDLAGGFIRVKRQKTGVWSRVPITKPCRAALTQAISRSKTSRVFNLSISTVVRQFAAIKDRAAIRRRLRFKDLRHSFGSNLAQHGVPINIIKECMGHSNIQTTLRYARVNEDAVKSQVLTALEG
jgi:integrase